MRIRFLTLMSILSLGLSCSRSDQKTPSNGDVKSSVALPAARPIGTPIAFQSPLGLPALDVPSDNPPTTDSIALGRKLYYDTKLSSDNSISCASCHNPKLGFSDGQKTSPGVGGKRGKRNSPTIWNAAYSSLQFWDGRAASLEEQAAGPIANPGEMSMPHDVCVQRLSADPEYPALFAKAFGPGPISIHRVQNAIASFERSVVSGNSPFDRYLYGGEKTAMSAEAVRGMAIFRDPGKGNCAVCHTIAEKSALFTDKKFHNLGVGIDPSGELTDLGRYDQTNNNVDKGAFKTPGLRNVAQSAPYMHDGSLRTLKEVVDFYAGGGNGNPYLDANIKPLNLSSAERKDLVAFLEALTGDTPADVGPPLAGNGPKN